MGREVLKLRSPGLDISVVIPSYEAHDTIGRCLRAVVSQETALNYEIIVVDSSPDDRVDRIVSGFPRVKFIKIGNQTCQGVARNIGARDAKGELLVFVDADIIVPPRWLENAMRYYRAGHDIFVGSINLDREHGKYIFDRLEWFFEFSEFKPLMPEGIRWCLPAYSIGIKRQIFAEDPFYDIAYSEDLEFTVRLRKKGHILYFYPKLSVLHNSHHGFGLILKKIFHHGRCHMKVRRMHNISGSAVVRIRTLVFLAVPLFAAVKFMKISWRNMRYNEWSDRILYIISIAAIVVMTGAWMAGFYRELFSDKPT